MANTLIGFISLLIFSFYDPSLVVYRVGMVNEIALALIGLLFIANHDRVLDLLFSPIRREKLKVAYCTFWLCWGMYFMLHAVMGLTSIGFASSRVVRVLFVILFFLNLRSLSQFTVALRVLVALAVFYSATSIAFHVVTQMYGVPSAVFVHVPVVDVDYADLGIYGYMWPTNYSFPMRLGGVTIYRISSFFNESAAYAFFLEPILFYVLHLRARSRHKLFYNMFFLVILGGIAASTSAAGLVAVLLAFLLLMLLRDTGAGTKFLYAGSAVLAVYVFIHSGASVLDDIMSAKQGTIGMETEGIERGLGLLHGTALVVGTGYDYVRDGFYVSANAALSNLQRGGLIGFAFFAGSLVFIAWQAFRADAKTLLKNKEWAAFAMLPNFIHLGIKVTYEFTFIYLINYSLVFWYLSYVRKKNTAIVGQG